MTTMLQSPSVLSKHIEMGVVELLVKDLARQRYFYEELVGLEIITETATELLLGFADRPIIKLIVSDLPRAVAGSAGLYHTAIVFAQRPALAQALKRIVSDAPALYSGSADHLVSEAFYFNDPEGNGVELYFDKDPSTWVWHDGHIMMDSLYLDVREYITLHEPLTAPLTKKIGHVHLKVGDIATAKNFYVTVLGFRIIVEMPTALFVSDGQYHHHLGMNVWESVGAQYRSPSLGLQSFTMYLETLTDMEKLRHRLEKATVEYDSKQDQLSLFDPWGNQLNFSTKLNS